MMPLLAVVNVTALVACLVALAGLAALVHTHGTGWLARALVWATLARATAILVYLSAVTHGQATLMLGPEACIANVGSAVFLAVLLPYLEAALGARVVRT